MGSIFSSLFGVTSVYNEIFLAAEENEAALAVCMSVGKRFISASKEEEEEEEEEGEEAHSSLHQPPGSSLSLVCISSRSLSCPHPPCIFLRLSSYRLIPPSLSISLKYDEIVLNYLNGLLDFNDFFLWGLLDFFHMKYLSGLVDFVRFLNMRMVGFVSLSGLVDFN